MQGWNKAGVRTERVIVDGRSFDAPLVVTKSGEILPMIVRFPELPSRGNSEESSFQKRHEAAEAVIDTMDLILRLRDARKTTGMGHAVDDIMRPALELLSDATQLYRASRSDHEIQRLCVLLTRQVRMGLLNLKVRRAVFKALKARNPNIVYRRFTRTPRADENGNFLKDPQGRRQFTTELSRQYRRGRVRRIPRGGVYEIIQSTVAVSMPALHVDWERCPPTQEQEASTMKFLRTVQGSDALEEFCIGSLPEEGFDYDLSEKDGPGCYGDELHLCCALPSAPLQSGAFCKTELHNLFVTEWQPWGTEEDSAVVAYAALLRDGVMMCERMVCHGLNRRTYAELQVQGSSRR